MSKMKWLVPTIYIVFLMLPIYWLLNMSFKTTTEIINVYSLWPQDFTLINYKTIFTDSTWYMGYINSISYVAINTVLCVIFALPAAYAFSRYNFLGDKHMVKLPRIVTFIILMSLYRIFIKFTHAVIKSLIKNCIKKLSRRIRSFVCKPCSCWVFKAQQPSIFSVASWFCIGSSSLYCCLLNIGR